MLDSPIGPAPNRGCFICSSFEKQTLNARRRYIKTGGTDKCFSGSGGGHASGAQIKLRQVSGLW
jgi:hypothetical protein